MFYQLGLRQFAGLRKFKLQPAPSVKELLTLAVEAAPDVHKAPISPSEIVKVITHISKKEDGIKIMLNYACHLPENF